MIQMCLVCGLVLPSSVSAVDQFTSVTSEVLNIKAVRNITSVSFTKPSSWSSDIVTCKDIKGSQCQVCDYNYLKGLRCVNLFLHISETLCEILAMLEYEIVFKRENFNPDFITNCIEYIMPFKHLLCHPIF